MVSIGQPNNFGIIESFPRTGLLTAIPVYQALLPLHYISVGVNSGYLDAVQLAALACLPRLFGSSPVCHSSATGRLVYRFAVFIDNIVLCQSGPVLTFWSSRDWSG